MIELVDTHCHIQSTGSKNLDDYTVKKWHGGGISSANELINSAKQAGVGKLVCVGTDLESSRLAGELAQKQGSCHSSIGVHPHEAKKHLGIDPKLQQISSLLDQQMAAATKPVAIGEVGLDYYYEHSPRQDQMKLLEQFLQVAVEQNLPVIFHVREAHSDFWSILDNFRNIRGVLHSFSAGVKELEQACKRNLFIGLNGIMTFTKEEQHLKAAKAVPLEKLVLETDAPYLAPKPYRGKVCRPEYVRDIAEFLASLRGETLEHFARKTTNNADSLFGLK